MILTSMTIVTREMFRLPVRHVDGVGDRDDHHEVAVRALGVGDGAEVDEGVQVTRPLMSRYRRHLVEANPPDL